jgi:hypothetical protein
MSETLKPNIDGHLLVKPLSIYGRERSAAGKSLLELNFSNLGCPNQLVLCYVNRYEKINVADLFR